ncbi:MAG: hypothetical protein H7174_02495 [Flavobacterium sp.]|nr:hypothetical protein [Flavobacterium sp.]
MTDVYFTKGDTLVNGFNYKILDGYNFQSRTFLLRENTISKKVFLSKINTNSISEYLLYDFTLNEGNTFNMENPSSHFPLHGGEYVLDSIRIKPIVNNDMCKHFYFSPTASNLICNYKVVWIEGIGSKSLIKAPGGQADINNAGQLSCCFKNQNLVYSQLDSISSCNFQSLKTISSKILDDDLKLFSLNSENNFRLDNAEKVISIYLYDAIGRKVSKLIFLPSKIIDLDLSDTPSGLYF